MFLGSPVFVAMYDFQIVEPRIDTLAELFKSPFRPVADDYPTAVGRKGEGVVAEVGPVRPLAMADGV